MDDHIPKTIETLVEELISDPLIELVMKADGVDRAEALALLADVCVSLAARPGTGTADGEDLIFSSDRSKQYRTGVGILLCNTDGEVFVGQRNDVEGEAWQMPQGGVDEGEEPLAAAFRELREEIGTDNAAVLADSGGWLRYEWPREVARKLWDGQWRGQQLKCFAMRYLGRDEDINVATSQPEFSAWRWSPIDERPSLIVAFKRPIYERLISLFSPAEGQGD